jgi:NDP-sugar pyrophosphorylase family protein
MSGINQAIIIASGHNASLVQLTRDRPKAMLPVLGKPIVIRLMERMREAGIQHFIVVVGEEEGAVASYLNNGWVPDAKISIVLQPSRRGPADALACASSYITGPFLVASCDHLTPPNHIANLIQNFEQTNPDIALSAVASPTTGHLPGVSVDGDWVTGIFPAPSKEYQPLSVFLSYACSKRFLNHINPTARDDGEMTPAVQSLLTSGGSASYATAEWEMALVNEIDLLSINRRYLSEGRDTHILSEIPSSARITPPVRIDPQVSVGPNTKIGPNVYLESGSQIGPDAILWDALVLSNAAVPAKEVLHHQIVMRRARIIEAQPESEKTLPKKPKWDIEAMKKTRDDT